MSDKESELEQFAKKLSLFQEQHVTAITRMSNMVNQSSISRMVEQMSLSSKINSQYSQAWKAHQGLASAIQQASLAWNEPLSEIAKIASSPSFASGIKGITASNSINIAAIQSFYKSPSFASMVDAISNMDTPSWQSFVDNVPEDISSNINDIEQEIENDPETKASFQPLLDSMEEVLSSQVGAKLDFSKGNLTMTSLKIVIYVFILFFSIYGPDLLLSDPTDELVEVSKQSLEEQKRHNAVIEQNQLKNIELQQEQATDNKEQLEVSKDILSELEKINEQKKDSK
ncbi:hypothetical protein [Paenibacillus amylolyticus]|uniref:hypothetical protein n=1 Tax=Paenibacillus amylolyticus TaxID=1451 RepID=UPI003451028E